MQQLDPRTRQILTGAVINGSVATIPDQVSRPEWEAVAAVLIALGGNYDKRSKGYKFETNPAPAMREVLLTGQVSSVRATEGYVPTPDGIAETLTSHPFSDLDRLPAGARVLEPSAGGGQLVRAILDANKDVHVVAIEPNVARSALIGHDRGRVEVVNTTLEEYAAGASRGEQFDAVVMNPPFAVPGKPALWAEHVLLAWEMLRPGGRLVSVVPNSLLHRQDRLCQEIRRLVDEFGGSQALPADAFGGPATHALYLARPLGGQGPLASYVFRQYTEPVEPVRVAEPWLTARAVPEAPVQVWYDGWRSTDRVLRFQAQCHGCGWLLWGFDDGGNDCRGVLGDHSAGFSLAAFEYGAEGPSVGLCPCCGSTSKLYGEALAVARKLWSQWPWIAVGSVPGVTAPPVAAPDPWGPVLRQLELGLTPA